MVRAMCIMTGQSNGTWQTAVGFVGILFPAHHHHASHRHAEVVCGNCMGTPSAALVPPVL